MTYTNGSMVKKGLEASLNILEKWGVNEKKKALILDLRCSQFHSLEQLSTAQLHRISFILNIHAALRKLFTNDKNVYEFMTMENNSLFFAGKTPLSYIDTGDLLALEEVTKHISSISLGN